MANIDVLADGRPVTAPLFKQLLDLAGGDGVVGVHADILGKFSCVSRNLFLGKIGTLGVMGTSATHVLAANVRRLMEVPGSELSTQMKLAKKAGVDQKTISNILNPDQRRASASGKLPSPTLAQVEKIAAAFGLQVWQLLQPSVREVHALEPAEMGL